jgi:predicted GTPase/actin-like ATPase involved in cell morphogenesis
MTTKRLSHAIDFGTSTSAILVCRPDGTTIPVSDRSLYDSWSIPTAICVRPNGSVLVGSEAENSRNERPTAYRREFKRQFGSPTPSPVGGLLMTPAEMTVQVLRYLRERALEAVPGVPEQVLITIPVSWEAGNQALMRDAAAQAGYGDAEVVLIPEPVAALADVFGDPRGHGEFTALVYDLGGGTFDCALARGYQGRFEVLGMPGGIDSIGGTDFDGLLLGLLAERLGPSIGALLDGPAENTSVLARRLSLREASERIKWSLSEAQQYEDLLTALQPAVWVEVRRAEFEQLIKPLIAETVKECERLLGQLGMAWKDVDRVVPVGGSSKIPLVQSLLSRACGRAVLIPGDPARAVVSGAATLCQAGRRGVPLSSYAVDLNNLKRETMTDTIFDSEQADDELSGEALVEEVTALLDKHHDKLPTQRKPNILVCGQTGTGKTTTINTLFGEEVGRVGDFSVGTYEDELYEWQSEGHNIDVVDLPGLGDSKTHDKEYREMYRRRTEKADGFIVVLAPTRPASYGTIRTVNLLLSCGVEPERIVFAYNKMGELHAPVGGKMRHVRMDGLAGPATPDDARVIDTAREAFNADLSRELRGGQYAGRFPLEQVVAYDAVSGWNLFSVFDAVLTSLPGDSLVKWRDAVTRASQDLQRRTKKRIERETAEHRRQVAALEKERDRLAEQLRKQADEKKARDKAAADDEARKREREKIEAEQRALERERQRIAAEQARLEREREAARNVSYQREAHVATVSEKIVSWVKSGVKAIGRFFGR